MDLSFVCCLRIVIFTCRHELSIFVHTSDWSSVRGFPVRVHTKTGLGLFSFEQILETHFTIF